MKTVEVTLYEYEELSDRAQRKALDDFVSQGGNFDSSEAYESLKAFENIFPISIKETNYGYGGIWSNFKFTADEDIENLTGWRLATYIWNNYRRYIYTYKHYYPKYKPGRPANFSKRRISRIKLESQSCPMTGVCYDEDILDPLWKFMARPDDRTFAELMRDCIYSFLKALQSEEEYRNSEAGFKDDIEANEWLFTEEGVRWD